MISSIAVRDNLIALHSMSNRRWLHYSGEVSRHVLKADILCALQATSPLLILPDYMDYQIDTLIQNVCDVVTDLQGLDPIRIGFYAEQNIVYLDDDSIEQFLEAHVSTRLLRMLSSISSTL